MNDFVGNYGPWALVTGASSGIGRAFSHALAERGLNVLLVARRVPQLQELAGALTQQHKIQARAAACDLSREDFMTALTPMLADVEVGLLVNNAGFSNTGEFVDNPLARELDLLQVNCRAALILAHTLGGRMKQRRRGGIVFVSSVAGFGAMPRWANYSASKAYDLLLGEALHEELKVHGVNVVTVCPGPTRTEFAGVSNVDFGLLTKGSAVLEPEQVAAAALQSLGRRSAVVVGAGNKMKAFSARLLPRWLVTRVFGHFVSVAGQAFGKTEARG